MVVTDNSGGCNMVINMQSLVPKVVICRLPLNSQALARAHNTHNASHFHTSLIELCIPHDSDTSRQNVLPSTSTLGVKKTMTTQFWPTTFPVASSCSRHRSTFTYTTHSGYDPTHPKLQPTKCNKYRLLSASNLWPSRHHAIIFHHQQEGTIQSHPHTVLLHVAGLMCLPISCLENTNSFGAVQVSYGTGSFQLICLKPDDLLLWKINDC